MDGDVIFVHFGTDEVGFLAALDVASGDEIWTHGKDGASYSSPLIAEIHGVRQVVEWNHRAVVGVESKTGRQLWEYPLPHIGSDQNMPTPSVHNGRILVGGENRGVFGLEPQLLNGKWSVKTLWHQEAVALNMSSAVVNDNRLYGFSHYDSGRIFSLDPDTGAVLWKGPPRTGKNVAFLAVPGYVLALMDTAELKVIRNRR